MNIFFDLDGTLLDARNRLYKLFAHLVPVCKMSYDGYWELKRNKINHESILANRFSYSDEDIAKFKKDWLEAIEQEPWLAHDMPFEGLSDFLSDLKSDNKLYLVTARQSEEACVAQLKRHHMFHLFDQVLVTSQKFEKDELMRTVDNIGSDDWMVGDTGKDIQVGKSLGMRTAAVLSGFLNREQLERYKPDVIVDYVTDLNFRQL